MKRNSGIAVYVGYYMSSTAVWGRLAPTIPPVRAFGTVGSMCLPGVCIVGEERADRRRRRRDAPYKVLGTATGAYSGL